MTVKEKVHCNVTLPCFLTDHFQKPEKKLELLEEICFKEKCKREYTDSCVSTQ